MFKIIPAAASGIQQSQTTRLIQDPDAINLSDTPTDGETGLDDFGNLTGSLQSLEFDGIDDYVKLATTNGFGTEILLEDMGHNEIKSGSTANNIAFEAWMKIDSSSTAIDKNSEFFEATIQRNSISSTTGYDGIYVCRTIYAPSAFNSDITTRPGLVDGKTVSAHYIELLYAGERTGQTEHTNNWTSTGDIFAYSITSSCDVPIDEWSHVWCEHTVTGNPVTKGFLENTNGHYFKIYINGGLDREMMGSTCIENASPNGANGLPLDPYSSTGAALSNFYNRSVSFDGKLDELRMWINSGTPQSISNISNKYTIGLKADQFPIDNTASPAATANSVTVQFSPSAEYLAAWWRFEGLSAVDLFAGAADSIPDSSGYSHSGTPVNFSGAIDISEENVVTEGQRFNNLWKMEGGTIDHGGLSLVHEKNKNFILLDEGMENLVTSGGCLWSSSGNASVDQDKLNIFYGASAVVVNTAAAGDAARHTIDYSNLLFDRNDYTVSFRGLLTSGSPTARVVFTIGDYSNSAATTAVFGTTTWKPIVLTKSLSANVDETTITGSLTVQQIHNDTPNDKGSLFRIDGLALQEGDYYSTYIGPDEIRKSGQVSWRVDD